LNSVFDQIGGFGRF
jgi:hypothetical protein